MPDSVAFWVAVGALVVAALSLLLSIRLAFRLRRIGRRRPSAGGDGTDLLAEIERVDALDAQLAGVAGRLEATEANGRRAMQRFGIVRYNPFEDTGSNQSFALAVLDAQGDGFVLTSQHSRQQTRVFLKAIAGGRSETAMSDEEAEAIRRATAR